MKLKHWPRSLRVLILAALLICVIPMVALVLHLLSTSLRALQDAVISSAQSETIFYAQMLDEEISQIQLRQYQLVSGDSINRLNVLYGQTSMSEQSSMVKDAYASLIMRTSLSNLIQTGTLYFPNHMKRAVSTTYWEDLSEQDLASVRALATANPSGFSISPEGITLLASYPLRAAQNADSSILSTAFLSRDRISQRLSEHATISQTTAFVLDAGAGTYFFSEGQESIALLASTKYAALADDKPAYFEITNWESPQVVTVAPVGNTGLYLMQITPQDETMALLLQYKTQIPVLITSMAVLILLLTALLYKLIYGPIAASRAAFQRTETGDFSYRLGDTWTTEFQTMFDQFNHMTQALQTHIQRENEFQRLASEAEIKQLQYQISPHFLYNSYFILKGMLIQQDIDQASNLASLMGRYLKYIVHVESPYAQLKDEIMHAHAYADIQKIRFGYRVNVNFDPCPESLETLRVPRLILQPLIENAFVHGVRNILEDGIVAIHFIEDEKGLDIVVEDNGAELSDTKLEALQEMMRNPSTTIYAGGIAINNINRRISLTYGESCGLRVDRSPLGGLRCTIRIGEKKYVQDPIGG